MNVQGFAVGLRSLATGMPLPKQWHFCLHCPEFASALRRFARCTRKPGPVHDPCIGKEGLHSAHDPPTLCNVIVKAILKLLKTVVHTPLTAQVITQAEACLSALKKKKREWKNRCDDSKLRGHYVVFVCVCLC